MKIAIFWDIAPCSQHMNRHFGGTYYLRLQGRKSAEQDTSESRWLGRNVGSYTDYTSLYPRRWQFSITLFMLSLSKFVAAPDDGDRQSMKLWVLTPFSHG
jgi:hypothetical protein